MTLKSPASKAATTATTATSITVASPFAISTEVFLLNSAVDRNASAGIPTFTVIAANTTKLSTPAPEFPAGLSAPKSTPSKTTTPAAGAVIRRVYTYSLTPASNIFEVPADRLMSAEGTFQLGDIVRQKTAMLNAQVEARYVVDGSVRYDVRDELETVVQGVGRDGEAGVVNGLVRVERREFWPVEMGLGRTRG